MGIKPISDRILDKNYLFALEFREGFVFGRTVRRRICQYKPYRLIDSAGSDIDIAASTHQAELWFRDPRNPKNDILYLAKSTSSGYAWFFHGAIGIKPQWINAYLRFPEGKEIPGKFPEVDPIRPSNGDDLGYLNSLNSPYEEPTDHIEIVIPPGLHIGCEYYNKDSDRAHQPVMNLLFALYWVQIFTKERHTNLIRRIALREIPAAFLMVGFGDTPQDMGSDLQKEWNAKPVSLDEAIGGS